MPGGAGERCSRAFIFHRCVIGRKRNAELYRRRYALFETRAGGDAGRFNPFAPPMTHVRVHARTDLRPRASADCGRLRLINLPLLSPCPSSRISSKAGGCEPLSIAEIEIRANRLLRIIRDGETVRRSVCSFARACMCVIGFPRATIRSPVGEKALYFKYANAQAHVLFRCACALALATARAREKC